MSARLLYAKLITIISSILIVGSCVELHDTLKNEPDVYTFTLDGELYNGVIYRKPIVRVMIYAGKEKELFDIELQSEMSDYVVHETGQGMHVTAITLEHTSFYREGINTVNITIRRKGERNIYHKELVRYQMIEKLSTAPDFYMLFGNMHYTRPTTVLEIETDKRYDIDTYYFGPHIHTQRIKEITIDGTHFELVFNEFDQEGYGSLWADKEEEGEMVFEVGNEYAYWEYRYKLIVHKAPDNPIIFDPHQL